MKISRTMGSICSNQTRNEGKPPGDLSELLQQTEKVRHEIRSPQAQRQGMENSRERESGEEMGWIEERRERVEMRETWIERVEMR